MVIAQPVLERQSMEQAAVDFIQSGRLGKIGIVRGWVYLDWIGSIGRPADCPPPPGVDYDTWLGPAPKRPYNSVLSPRGVHKHFPNWRNYREYSGGMMTDWGVHLLDIVQAAFDEEQPKSITALGGKYYLTDNRETPDTLQVTFEYASGFLATYGNRDGNSKSILGRPYGILFYGENGSLFVDRNEYFVMAEKKGGVEYYLIEQEGSAYPPLETAAKCLAAYRATRNA